mmetsp:Transcript_6815/g.16999  ORF Transcript_6815/g.16999 Transcript_6815/m.16999 type:complete len:125 (+) Transcript_6815:128-502(+)
MADHRVTTDHVTVQSPSDYDNNAHTFTTATCVPISQHHMYSSSKSGAMGGSMLANMAPVFDLGWVASCTTLCTVETSSQGLAPATCAWALLLTRAWNPSSIPFSWSCSDWASGGKLPAGEPPTG